MPVKLVLADSNELIRIGMKTIFATRPDVEVVGEADSSAKLKAMFSQMPVDVVLIDFTATGFSIDIIPEILTANPQTRFVAITPGQRGHIISAALRAGVTGYVKKDCSVEEILEAVRTESIDPDQIGPTDFTCDPIMLSEREQEVIKLIAEGYTNARIAELLFLSNHTVNTHRKNIMQKLGVNNTAAIVMFAVKNDLVNTNKFLFSPSVAE